VPKLEANTLAPAFVIVCVPSENENAVGDTDPNGKLSPKGDANVTVPLTKSLVV
jgi:hypothetical protein